jgi:hypothetical protein
MATVIIPWTLVPIAIFWEICSLMRSLLAMQVVRRLIDAGHPEHLDKLAAVVRADRPGIHLLHRHRL